MSKQLQPAWFPMWRTSLSLPAVHNLSCSAVVLNSESSMNWFEFQLPDDQETLAPESCRMPRMHVWAIRTKTQIHAGMFFLNENTNDRPKNGWKWVWDIPIYMHVIYIYICIYIYTYICVYIYTHTYYITAGKLNHRPLIGDGFSHLFLLLKLGMNGRPNDNPQGERCSSYFFTRKHSLINKQLIDIFIDFISHMLHVWYIYLHLGDY